MTDLPAVPACSRHPEKAASVVCARCDKPICTDCMIAASVGWQCPECVHQGASTSRVVQPFTDPNHTGVMGSTNPTPVVIGIIVVNVICFVASGFGKASVLNRFGSLSHQVQQSNEYYRFLTSMFLHVSIVHIALNMFTFIIIGPAVEIMLGKSRFLVLYLLAGLGGSLASYWFAPANSIGVGASGAIFGVMGAYLVLAGRRRQNLVPVLLLLGVNLIYGFADTTVDWHAHLGGLVVGVLLAAAYDQIALIRQPAQRIALTIGASVVVLAVIVVVVVAVAPPGHIIAQFG